MLIISDSSPYLFPTCAEKSGIKIISVIDFPLKKTKILVESNSDILILLSEFFYKQISIINDKNYFNNADFNFG